MRKVKAYLFPGQGSQARGMGAQLFDRFPAMVRAADGVLGYSLKALCLEDRQNQLQRTEYTQPALFAVEALDYLRLKEEGGVPPDFLAGHSLGEFAALFAAGVFDFETGLRLVQKRGALMSQAPAGGMAAVIGLSPAKVRSILANSGFGAIDIANDNAPSQTVVAGLKEDVAAAQKVFEAAGGRYVILNVGAAFHSRYMRPAQEQFTSFLKGFTFGTPSIPVLSNVTATPHEPSTIRERLIEQIASPVRWTESIVFLHNNAVSEYVEVGPGQVLTRLVDKIRDEGGFRSHAVIAPPTATLDAPAPASQMPAAGTVVKAARPNGKLAATTLGDPAFREDHGVSHAYVGGSMMHGVASAAMVIALGKAGFLGFYGADGVDRATALADIAAIRSALGQASFGVGITADWTDPDHDLRRVEAYLAAGVRLIEVSGFLLPSPALVRFRLKGAHRSATGQAVAKNRILARVGRPAAATAFLEPSPAPIVSRLLQDGLITREEAEAAPHLPLADDICAQADGGGPTDGANLLSLLPALLVLRDRQHTASPGLPRVRIGAAGALGTPHAVAGAFMMGADFVLLSSIHQCTLEAGTSALVKDMLQAIEVGDTDHAPSGPLFEQGGQVQVLRKGVFFPARARKLYSVWQHHASLESIDAQTRDQIEEKFLGMSFDVAWQAACKDAERSSSASIVAAELARTERDPKARMATVFRHYFTLGMRSALAGDAARRVNFEVPCGPGLGALNGWISNLPWQQRPVAEIARRIMDGAAELVDARALQYRADRG